MQITKYLVIAALAVSEANALKMSFFVGSNCRGQGVGAENVTPSSGCQTKFSGLASSALISGNGGTVVFYKSNNCNPSTVIKRTRAGCATANYQSYRVV
jgi:hypothetical protein